MMTEPVKTCSVTAAQEQAWNEAQLSVPVISAAARLWHYPEPAVVLGRSQHRLRNSLDCDAYPVVERGAGGGAVLVGPWLLGASVVLPPAHPLIAGQSISDSYCWLGELFVDALADQGVTAVSVPREQTWQAPTNLAWACFAGMSPWELAIDGRKLVGFAQRRGRHGVLLVAGALVSAVPWLRLCRALRRPDIEAEELKAATIDASAAIGRPLAMSGLADSLARRLLQALDRQCYDRESRRGDGTPSHAGGRRGVRDVQ